MLGGVMRPFWNNLKFIVVHREMIHKWKIFKTVNNLPRNPCPSKCHPKVILCFKWLCNYYFLTLVLQLYAIIIHFIAAQRNCQKKGGKEKKPKSYISLYRPIRCQNSWQHNWVTRRNPFSLKRRGQHRSYSSTMIPNIKANIQPNGWKEKKQGVAVTQSKSRL